MKTTRRKLSRRAFIARAAVGGTALAVPAGGLGWVFRDEIRNLQFGEIRTILEQRYFYLTFELSDEQWERFALDYGTHYRPIVRDAWQRLLRGRDESFFHEKIDHLAATFLMSTDFFLNGGDESKPVKYAMLYHPYVSPCWNPISMAAANTI